jgi:light-regulated signal transduction histidine kinase (bacteriophytochrome)
LVVRDYKDTIKQLYLHLENIISNEAGRLSDSGRANIRRSQAAIQKMNLLTDDINNYFQLYDTTFEPGPVDTMVLVREVIATFHDRLQECNGSVECGTLPVLVSHPVLFTRLLSHLVGNSIKFRSLVTPLVIRIHHSMAEKLNGKPGAFPETPYDIISVSDNGLGYDNAESEKIFWLFYRAVGNKTKGSGIGLAICRKIMKMHNGFITGEGQPDRGATFNCHFPVRKQGEQG